MCLMKGRSSQDCKHKKCWEHLNYPQYNGINKANTISIRTDFELFRKFKKGKGAFLLAVNPYDRGTTERSEFKKFEKLSYLETFGDWPGDQDIFNRLEVSIEYVQYAKAKWVDNPIKGKLEKKWNIDVKEAAVYVKGGGCNEDS